MKPRRPHQPRQPMARRRWRRLPGGARSYGTGRGSPRCPARARSRRSHPGSPRRDQASAAAATRPPTPPGSRRCQARCRSRCRQAGRYRSWGRSPRPLPRLALRNRLLQPRPLLPSPRRCRPLPSRPRRSLLLPILDRFAFPGGAADADPTLSFVKMEGLGTISWSSTSVIPPRRPGSTTAPPSYVSATATAALVPTAYWRCSRRAPESPPWRGCGS